MRLSVRSCIMVGSLTLLFVMLQPVYANGEHMHVGGIFLVLLGGVVFLGSLVVVFYMLLRSPPPEAEEAEEGPEPHHDDRMRGE
ncbi:MAG: hypothetical protein AB7N91_15555 [Candidatus Tectimicrobiota bacterium]